MPPVGQDSSTRRRFGPGLYAPTDDATTTCPTPASAAAASTCRVPATFVAARTRSSWFGCSSQARWTTASAPANAAASDPTAAGTETSASCHSTPA